MPKSSQVAPSGEETRQRILEAAARVFAENGYARATTRRLAATAGVNEVTLFRHFTNKQKLFAAVVEQFGGPAVTAAIEAQLTGDYRQDLLRIGQYFMALVVERRDIIRLMTCEAGHFPDLADVLAQNPRLMRQSLARYLQQQIDLGRVRPINVEAAAQAFWGMFFTYGLGQDVYAERMGMRVSAEEMVGHFVDLFVHGTIRQE
jgi:AcrR family transcriptional regulator